MSDTWFLYSVFALFVSLFIQDFSHFREKNVFFVRSLLILYLLSLTMTSFSCSTSSCSWSQTISFRCTPNSFPVAYCLFPISTPTGTYIQLEKTFHLSISTFFLTQLPPFTQQPAGNFCTHFILFFFWFPTWSLQFLLSLLKMPSLHSAYLQWVPVLHSFLLGTFSFLVFWCLVGLGLTW